MCKHRRGGPLCPPDREHTEVLPYETTTLPRLERWLAKTDFQAGEELQPIYLTNK